MAASQITFAVEVDWDRNGTFDTDITGDVEGPGGGIRIDRGMGEDGIYRISRVTIDVSNRAGTYSYGNTASTRFGQVRPGVPIRVKVTHNTIAYVLWTGYIQKFKAKDYMAGHVPICTFECTDLADYLRQYTPVNVTAATRTTSAAYAAIASAAGLSVGDYSFATGVQSLPFHWVRNADALTAFADVLASELGGSWYINANGVIQGQSRATRLGITGLDQTWGDTTTIMPRNVTVEVDDSDLISSATVQADVYQTGNESELIFTISRGAKTGDSLLIPAGSVYGPVSIDYPQPILSAVAQVAGTDYTFNTAIDGTGTDITADLVVTMTEQGAGFELKLKNNNASNGYLTKFEKYGMPEYYIIDKPIFTTTKSIVGDKLIRGMQVKVPFADDSNATRDYSVQLLRIYRYEYPRLTLGFEAGANDATMVAMLSLEIGDLIKYKDTAVTTINTSYSNDWWYVESLKYSISTDASRQNFQTVVNLIPSYLFRNLDKIVYDNFDRANATGDLGSSTQGAAWANDGSMNIVSNAAQANSDVLQVPDLDVGSGVADMVVEVSLAAIGTGDEVGVTFRKTDASNYYNAYVDKGDNTVKVEKNVAAAVTQLASVAYTVGTTAEIRVIIQSTRIRVWVDRYLYVDTTDSSLATGTKAGLWARNAFGTTTFEDFYAQGM